MLKLNFAAASDRGLVRGNNEDSAYAGPHLLALADGMGGHAAGEIASQLMINSLRVLDQEPGDNDMPALLGAAADDGNRAIAQAVREAPELDGMGTTLDALLFNGTHMALIHVGDSRAFRLRGGKLERLTVDDTYVQALVNDGKLDPEEVSTHPQRSLILKAYTGRPVEPTLSSFEVLEGDRFLLCSDGLSDPVTCETIESCLGKGSPAEAARTLVDLALRGGGPDNVTVVIADAAVPPAGAADAAGAREGGFPVEPVTAGALSGDSQEDPRPDTAAGRAARMTAQQRQPQVIDPRGNSTPQPLPGAEAAAAGAESTGAPVKGTGAPEASSGRALGWIIAAVAVVLVALIGGGAWLTASQMRSTYYVAESDGKIVIDKGLKSTAFGGRLHHRYQETCIDREGTVKLVDFEDPAAPEASCNRFAVTDLPQSLRSQVGSLPAGSYDEVVAQVKRLSTDALPVCVTRTPVQADTAAGAAESTGAAAQPSGTAAAAPAATKSSAAAASTAASESAAASTVSGADDLQTPGENCREVS